MRSGRKPAATRGTPHDPALNALAELFPIEGAPGFVRQAAGEAAGRDFQPSDGKAVYIRYRPTRNCVALWSFPAADGQQVLISATLFRDERGARIAARRSFLALAGDVRRSDGGPEPFRYLPDKRILVQRFPLDVRLPGLALARSAEWRRDHLLPQLGLTNDGAVSDTAADVALKTIDYKPRHRCVLRFDVTLKEGRAGYFAKLFRDDRGERFLSWLQTISAQLDSDGAPWSIAPPVAYLPDAWMLLLGAVDDALELKDLIKEARGDAGARSALNGQMEQAADGLQFLHRQEVGGLPAVPPKALLQRFEDSMEGLPLVDPAAAELIIACLRTLEEQASRLPPEPMVTTHGAYRHDQILIRGKRQTVLDLDTLCLSGASADAGNFLSYLDVTAERRRRQRPVIEECAPFFEERALRLPSVSPEWLAWYRAAGHVKKAVRSYLSLDAKWPQMADAFLRPIAQTQLGVRGAAGSRPSG